MNKQGGFSLPETLVALLLFSLSFTALLHYQLAQAKGFQLQIQQREAWYRAWLRFEGYEAAGWETTLGKKMGPAGCQLLTSIAVSPAGREATLQQLRCNKNSD